MTYFNNLNYSIEQWTGANCRAINNFNNSDRCDIFYNAFINDVVPSLNANDILIISSRWINSLDDMDEGEFIRRVDNLFNSLKLSGANVVVVGNTPEFNKSPFILMLQNKLISNEIGNISFVSKDFRKFNQILSLEAQRYGYEFFNPAEVLCDKNNELLCLVSENKSFIFFDTAHLSMYGSLKVISKMKSNLKIFSLTKEGLQKSTQ